MSDMQSPAPPAGQVRTQGNPMAGNDPMSRNRTMLNPADAAFMRKSGQVSPDMTFGQFIETSFGIKWDDPVQQAVQKMQKNMQNASPIGKMQNIAAEGRQGGTPQGGAPRPMPQGRKPMVQSGGLEGLIGQMGQ